MFTIVRISACAFAVTALLGGVTNALAANLVANGSMTGPPTIDTPPPGWTSVDTDGDTIPVGGLDGWGTGIAASPDGGTFLSVLNNGGGGAFDAASQTVGGGFVVGYVYTLQFAFANMGLDSTAAPDYANPGFIRANIAGVNFDTSVLSHDGFGSQRWFDFAGAFTATAPSMSLTFSAVRQANGIGGYAGGVDGVLISAVPEPSSTLLLCLGIAAVALRLRQRTL